MLPQAVAVAVSAPHVLPHPARTPRAPSGPIVFKPMGAPRAHQSFVDETGPGGV